MPRPAIFANFETFLQILNPREGENYCSESFIHAVTVCPIFCLNAALKVL